MTEEAQVSPSETVQETSTEESTQETTQSPAFNLGEYFPEDVRSDPDFERISKNMPLDKPEMLAKELYHKTKHFGKVKEEMRKELEGESNKEYTPEEYSYEAPENYEANEEILGVVKAKAQELGVKPEAFKALVESFMGSEQGVLSQMQEQQEEDFNTRLKEEADFIKSKTGLDSEKLIEQSKTTWANFADPKYKDVFDNFDKGSQLVIADLLNNVASRVSEPSTGKQAPSYTMSSDSALTKIAEVRADKALNDGERNQQLAELYPIAYQNQDAKSLGVHSSFGSISA